MCSKIPNTKVIQPIILRFLIFSIRLDSIRKNPINIIGIDDIKILKKSILLSKKLKISLRKKTKTAINDPICKLVSMDKL